MIRIRAIGTVSAFVAALSLVACTAPTSPPSTSSSATVVQSPAPDIAQTVTLDAATGRILSSTAHD